MLNTNHNLLFKAIVLALCVISFVHVFLFPLYDMRASRSPVRSYLDLEQSLCTGRLKNKPKRSSQTLARRSTRCPQYGIVTVMEGGRLGNQMWEYASVWALARRTGLEPYVPRCIRSKLDQIFEQLSVPTLDEIGQCPVGAGRFVRSPEQWNYTNQSIILPRYSFQVELVLTWDRDVVQEFAFKKKLVQKSQQMLKAAANGRKVCTFVGVHVRRTDYAGYLKKKYSQKAAQIGFYKQAMKYYEDKYEGVVFVVVSDDPAWCRKKFGRKANVHVASGTHRNSPGLDLALLASCNHSIYDYGTFGEWGALLAGGETVYYNLSDYNGSTGRLGALKNWRAV